MNVYPAGLAANVVFELVDLNGAPVTPTALSYRVEDDAGGEIVPDTVIAVPTSGPLTISVPAPVNTLAPGKTDGLRTVVLSVTVDEGTFEVSESYLLRGRTRLVVLENSFQTYEQAILLSSRMPGMTGWNAAGVNDRTVALMEAFTRLTRFQYRIKRYDEWENEQDYLLPREEEIITPLRWSTLTLGEWGSILFGRFRTAISRAQIAEAADILSYDPVNEKRRQGILSETVGESSMMFRSGKPIEAGICKSSLNELRGFLYTRVMTTRV